MFQHPLSLLKNPELLFLLLSFALLPKFVLMLSASVSALHPQLT
jgi:hypothetical protein